MATEKIGSFEYDVSVDIGVERVLTESETLRRVLEEQARVATTTANRQFAKLGVEQVKDLRVRFAQAFTAITTASAGANRKMTADAKTELRNTFRAFEQLQNDTKKILAQSLADQAAIRKAAAKAQVEVEKAAALEVEKTKGKAARDAAQDARVIATQAGVDQRRIDAQTRSDKLRGDAQAAEAARAQARSQQSQFRLNALAELDAQRNGNRLELAEEKGHQFRKSEILKVGLAGAITTLRNFYIRRREDQRHENRLSVIEDERKSKESLANLQSELRTKETLSRSSAVRQQASSSISTNASKGVAGAALGRNAAGIGLRNLAFAGGGILSARSTLTIGMDFVGALRVAQAQLNLTEAQMKLLHDTSIELGKAIDLPGVSAKDAADAMLQLAKSGLSLEQTIGAARGTLELARAANTDFAEAAFQVGAAINVFDIAATDATKVADIMAKTIAVAGGTSFDDLSLAVRQSAAVFALNQKGVVGANNAYAELNATLAVLAKNGLRGSDAGTSLKQMILALTSPSNAQSGILEELAKNVGVVSIAYDSVTKKARPFTEQIALLGKSIKGMSQQARDQALGDLFGSDAVRASAILAENADDLEATYKEILASQRTATTKGFAALLAEARNKGLKGAVDVLRSQIETFQILLFEKIEEPLRRFVFFIATGIDKLANDPNFAAIRTGLKLTAIAIGGLLAAKAAGEAISFLSNALKLLAFSPLGLLAVGIVAAAFAIGYFATKNKEFGAALKELLDDVKRIGKGIVAAVLHGDWNKAKDGLLELLNTIAHFPLVEFLGRTLKNAALTVRNTAIALGKAVIDGIFAGIAFAQEFGPKILKVITDALASVAGGALAIGREVMARITEGIAAAGGGAAIALFVGTNILKGISEAGRLIALALTHHITIEVVTGIAVALAAAAIAIAGSFVKGFVTGLIQNRGEIAEALATILGLAIGAALVGIGKLITGHPVWGTIIVFLATVFAGAKVFSSLSTAFKGFSTNVKSGLAAMNGDFDRSRKVVQEHRLEIRKMRVGELDALGSSLPKVGRAINQSLVEPTKKATTAMGHLVQRFKDFRAGVQGDFDLKAPAVAQNQQLSLFPAARAPEQLSLPGIPTGEEQRLADLNREINNHNKLVVAAGIAAAAATVGMASFFAFSSTDTTTKVISSATAVTGIVTAFAQGGPVAGGFAVAATLVGAALGSHAKKAKESKDRMKEWTDILKIADETARRSASIDRLAQKFEDGDKAAKHFATDLGGNMADLVDAINLGEDALNAYLAALVAAKGGMKNLSDSQKFGIIFAQDEFKARENSLKTQQFLAAAIVNAKDKQAALTKLAELDAEARTNALNAQRELLGLLASNESGVIGLALGLESFSKQAAAIAAAPADEQARLRLELEQTARGLSDNYVKGVEDAIEAGKALGIDPITAVQNYDKEIRTKLIDGLKLSKADADILMAKLLEFGGLQVKATVDIAVDENKAAAIAALARDFGIIAAGGQIIDMGGGALSAPGTATGGIFTRPQTRLIAEAGDEAVIPLDDPERAFALLVASGLDKLVAARSEAPLTNTPVSSQGPLIGELHVNEVAGDPVATGIVAGRHIAAIIQGALA